MLSRRSFFRAFVSVLALLDAVIALHGHETGLHGTRHLATLAVRMVRRINHNRIMGSWSAGWLGEITRTETVGDAGNEEKRWLEVLSWPDRVFVIHNLFTPGNSFRDCLHIHGLQWSTE
jgi:hypothetical protein